jgi:hypothetical protein
MKLQKRLNRKVGDKEYLKWYVDIPSSMIDEADWKEGTNLEVKVKNNKIILEPSKD